MVERIHLTFISYLTAVDYWILFHVYYVHKKVVRHDGIFGCSTQQESHCNLCAFPLHFTRGQYM